MLSKDRLGKFTGSGVWQLFVGGKGVTRSNYIMEKAEEVVKGYGKSFSSYHTEHGLNNQFEALQEFARMSGLLIEINTDETYFPFNDNCGATPDAFVVDFEGNRIATVDAKCPTETFFKQKLLFINEAKPEYQNVPRDMYYQGKLQMMSAKVDKHYLVRYFTTPEEDEFGNKIEPLPIEARIFWALINKDESVCNEVEAEVAKAAEERDLLVKIFRQSIIPA